MTAMLVSSAPWNSLCNGDYFSHGGLTKQNQLDTAARLRRRICSICHVDPETNAGLNPTS